VSTERTRAAAPPPRSPVPGEPAAVQQLAVVRALLSTAVDAAEARLDRLAACPPGPQPGVVVALDETARSLIAAVRTALGAEHDPAAGYHAAVQSARVELAQLRTGGAR